MLIQFAFILETMGCLWSKVFKYFTTLQREQNLSPGGHTYRTSRRSHQKQHAVICNGANQVLLAVRLPLLLRVRLCICLRVCMCLTLWVVDASGPVTSKRQWSQAFVTVGRSRRSRRDFRFVASGFARQRLQKSITSESMRKGDEGDERGEGRNTVGKVWWGWERANHQKVVGWFVRDDLLTKMSTLFDRCWRVNCVTYISFITGYQ